MIKAPPFTPSATGPVSATISIANNTNTKNPYDFVVQGTGVIKQDQTITFTAPGGKTYGDASFALGATASSGLPVSYTVISGPATVSGDMLTITGAGDVTVRASQVGDAAYNAAPNVEQTFTVAKAPLTITAVNKTVTQGAVMPTLAASYSGFVNSDTEASLDTPLTLTTTATSTNQAGTYDIVASGAADANYTITFVKGTLTVTGTGVKQDQTITFTAPGGKTYGDASFALGATASSGLAVTYTVVSGPATVSGNMLTITGAGNVTVRASQPGNATYNAAANIEQTFTVAKAPIDLEVIQTSQVNALINLTLTITVRNNGPKAVISDTFPATFVGSVWNWTCAGTACSAASGTGDLSASNATLGNLAVNGTVVYTVTGTLKNWSVWTNTASVIPPSDFADSLSANNRSTVGKYQTLLPLIYR